MSCTSGDDCDSPVFADGLCRAHWTLAGLGISRPTRKVQALERARAQVRTTTQPLPPRPAPGEPTFVRPHGRY